MWPWPFWGASLALGSALERLLHSNTELVVSGCCMKSTFHRMSQSDQGMAHCCCIEKQDTSKRWFFFDLWSTHEAPAYWAFSPFQFSSVAQSYPTLCSPMDCSMTGFPVHPQLPELTQTHVHWVSDAIKLPHPLSSPSPPAFNLAQHQCLFKWVSSSHQVAKYGV